MLNTRPGAPPPRRLARRPAQLQREAQLVTGAPPNHDVLQVLVAQRVVARGGGLTWTDLDLLAAGWTARPWTGDDPRCAAGERRRPDDARAARDAVADAPRRRTGAAVIRSGSCRFGGSPAASRYLRGMPQSLMPSDDHPALAAVDALRLQLDELGSAIETARPRIRGRDDVADLSRAAVALNRLELLLVFPRLEDFVCNLLHPFYHGGAVRSARVAGGAADHNSHRVIEQVVGVGARAENINAMGDGACCAACEDNDGAYFQQCRPPKLAAEAHVDPRASEDEFGRGFHCIAAREALVGSFAYGEV